MACPYCDSTAKYCKCRNDFWENPHRSRKRTYDHPRSWRDERPLRQSSCRRHHDHRESRSKSRHRRHSSCHRHNDHHSPRSKSRHRHHSDGHLSSCEYCNEDSRQCDRIALFDDNSYPRNYSRHRHDRCGRHSSETRSKHNEHKPSKDTEQTLRIQLFEAKNKENRYEEATEIYRDALSFDKTRGSSDKMLKLKAAFADMQVKEGNCNEAERVLGDILRWSDLPSGLETQCLGIHGKILCARKRYTEAENLYRKLYDRASKDEISLAMGDEMCNAIALQGDLDRAQLEQRALTEKRKQILGTGHPATVKSANKAVGNIRKMIQRFSKESNVEMQRKIKRKQVLEADIEYLLRDIWESLRGSTKNREPEALKLGYELGLSLSNQSKFDQAERVLAEVWEGRTEKLGETNKDTLSTGICLGQAMYCQAFDGPSSSQEMVGTMYHQHPGETGYDQGLRAQRNPLDGSSKCAAAIAVLNPIWANASRQAYADDHSIAKAAGAHLGIALTMLGKYREAEHFFVRTISLPVTESGVLMPPLDLVQYAWHVIQHVTWDKKAKSYRMKKGAGGLSRQLLAQSTLMPKALLTGISTSRAAPNRLAITSGSVNAPSAFGYSTGQGQGNNNYEIALSQGMYSMRIGDYRNAAKVLGPAWSQPTAIVREREARARCGDKYGYCLEKIGKTRKAVTVYNAVKAFKKRSGLPDEEIRRTRVLVRRAESLVL